MINGHVYPEVERSPEIRFRQPRLLYWNVGGGRFKDISAAAGPGSRRAVVVARVRRRRSRQRRLARGRRQQHGRAPSLLKNFGPRKNWLLVRLQGVGSNRDAMGARVSVYVGGRRLSGEVQTGSSYLSQNDPRLHFGLAGDDRYDRIEVAWPGGQREVFPAGAANRIVRLGQGSGTPASTPPPAAAPRR